MNVDLDSHVRLWYFYCVFRSLFKLALFVAALNHPDEVVAYLDKYKADLS